MFNELLRRFSNLIILAFCVVILSGCLVSSRNIIIKADGSAIIIDTFLVAKSNLNFVVNNTFKSEQRNMTFTSDSDKINWYFQTKATQDAKTFFPNAIREQYLRLENDANIGTICVYKIPDINNFLLINSSDISSKYSFFPDYKIGFAKTDLQGVGSVTIIKQNHDESKKQDVEDDKSKTKLENDTMLLSMYSEMVKGIVIRSTLSFEGTIIKSNATVQNSNTVTLLNVQNIDGYIKSLLKEKRLPPQFDGKHKTSDVLLEVMLKSGKMLMENKPEIQIQIKAN